MLTLFVIKNSSISLPPVWPNSSTGLQLISHYQISVFRFLPTIFDLIIIWLFFLSIFFSHLPPPCLSISTNNVLLNHPPLLNFSSPRRLVHNQCDVTCAQFRPYQSSRFLPQEARQKVSSTPSKQLICKNKTKTNRRLPNWVSMAVYSSCLSYFLGGPHHYLIRRRTTGALCNPVFSLFISNPASQICCDFDPVWFLFLNPLISSRRPPTPDPGLFISFLDKSFHLHEFHLWNIILNTTSTLYFIFTFQCASRLDDFGLRLELCGLFIDLVL